MGPATGSQEKDNKTARSWAVVVGDIQMKALLKLSAMLSRLGLHVACAALAGLGLVVVYGVVLRYLFNDAPAYVEQSALLLVITVAMFGAAAGVHDMGHIGLDSLVKSLSPAARRMVHVVVELCMIGFALILLWGSYSMAVSVHQDLIPTLGISEAFRYLPSICASVLITLFSVTHLLCTIGGHRGAQ
jgi:TRAP-type transport system small permease protein